MDLEKGLAFLRGIDQDRDEIGIKLNEVALDIRGRISTKAQELSELGGFPLRVACLVNDQLEPELIPILSVGLVPVTNECVITADGKVLDCNHYRSGERYVYDLSSALPVSDEVIRKSYRHILATMSHEVNMALLKD